MSGKSKKRGNTKSKEPGHYKKSGGQPKDSATTNDTQKQQTPLPDSAGLWQYEICDQTLPQEKVAKVKPYWEQLTQSERLDILQISVDELRSKAHEFMNQCRFRLEHAVKTNEKVTPLDFESFVTILDTGLKRMKENGTWKLWQWMQDKTFTDMESFRTYVEENHMSAELRSLMTRDESKMETYTETALRKRMQEVLDYVHNQIKMFSDELSGNRKLFVVPKGQALAGTSNRVDIKQVIFEKNVELSKYMLKHIGKEHELLSQSILMPVIEYIIEVLPENKRRTTHRDLANEDLDNLKAEEIGNVCEWLIEKVDGLTAKWKLDPEVDEEEDEDEVMGDIDLFQLSEDESKLLMNQKWLDHLQDRTLSEDGNPRKSKPDEDPSRVGLLLEWIFGSIVSTAEKAREGSKRILGNQLPDPRTAFRTLVTGLEEFKLWKECTTQRQDLLRQLDSLREKLQGVDLSRVSSATEGNEHQVLFPQHLIHMLLTRELALQQAKQLHMNFGINSITKDLSNLQVEIRQNENQIQRYRRMLEVLRLQSEMITYNANGATNVQQLATEQVELQAHLNATATVLTSLHHRKTKFESAKQLKEKEVEEIGQCKHALSQLIEKLDKIQQAQSEGVDVDLKAINNHELLVFNDANADKAMQCLAEYFENFWHCAITTRAEEETLCKKMKSELSVCEEKSDELKAVLGHLEMHFLNVSCDDPGTTIGVWLVLSILQERLEAQAFDFASKLAEEAQSEMLKQVEEEDMKVQQSRVRKASKKAKLKEKERQEREKHEAEKTAQLIAEQEAKEIAQKQQEEQQALDRKQREEEVERLRLQEEAALEQRRRQLMDGEDNHWKQRMQELQMQEWLSRPLSIEEVEEAAKQPNVILNNPSNDNYNYQPDYNSDRDIVVETRYPNNSRHRRQMPNKRNYERNRSINFKQHRNEQYGRNVVYQKDTQGDWNEEKRNRRNSHPPIRKSITGVSATTNTSSITQSSSIDENDVVVVTSMKSCPMDVRAGHEMQNQQQQFKDQFKQQEENLQQNFVEQQPPQRFPSKDPAHVDEQCTVSTDSVAHPDILPEFIQAGVGIEIKNIPSPPLTPTPPQVYPYPTHGFPVPPPTHGLVSHHSLPIITQHPITPPPTSFGPPPCMQFVHHASTGTLPYPPHPNWLQPPPIPFPMQFGPPQPYHPMPIPPENYAPQMMMPQELLQPASTRLNPGAKEFVPVPYNLEIQDEDNSPESGDSSATGFNYGMDINYPTVMDQVESKCGDANEVSNEFQSEDIAQIQLRLNLVRGLQNDMGQSNCFINVIVQSLWHLKAFRTSLLSISKQQVVVVGPSGDGLVLQALWELFQLFDRSPEADIFSGDNSTIVRSNSQKWSLSAQELREAISQLSGGNFVLNEMHDASEVLFEVLASMYRAQDYGSPFNTTDPFLPRKLTLEEEHSVYVNDSANLVQRFFGLDVRVLVGDDEPFYEQFLKFFHLIPAKGLQEASDKLFDESFETILRCAETPEQISNVDCIQKGHSKRNKLASLPGVFTIAVVWESPNVVPSEINTTVTALDTELDLSQLFDGLEECHSKSKYYLQCVVCYYRHHYYAFAFLEELDKWLLFDDSKIQIVGNFRKVQAMIVQEAWRPILLFYEQDEQV